MDPDASELVALRLEVQTLRQWKRQRLAEEGGGEEGEAGLESQLQNDADERPPQRFVCFALHPHLLSCQVSCVTMFVFCLQRQQRRRIALPTRRSPPVFVADRRG
jgi:hypothetical protein